MTNHRNAGNMRFRTRKGGSKRWSARRRTVLLAVAPSPASSDIRSGILPFYGAFSEVSPCPRCVRQQTLKAGSIDTGIVADAHRVPMALRDNPPALELHAMAVATAVIVTPAHATSASSSMSAEQARLRSLPVAGCRPASVSPLQECTGQATRSPIRIHW
jgi:hypothetical protein